MLFWNPDTNQFISRKKYDFEEVFISCVGIIFCQIYIVDLLLTLTFRLIYINSHVWNFLLM